MPKILTPAMRAHLDAETTRLAAIWRITRKDGAQFFFTDHDRDLVFGGNTYLAATGFDRTAISNDLTFAVDNLDLVGITDPGQIEPGRGEINVAAVHQVPVVIGEEERLPVAAFDAPGRAQPRRRQIEMVAQRRADGLGHGRSCSRWERGCVTTGVRS